MATHNIPEALVAPMKTLALLVIVPALLSLTAPRASALDLNHVLMAARHHDMGFAESGASYREARTEGPEARSAFLPHIQAYAGTAYNDLNSQILGGMPGFAFPSGHFAFNSHGYGISVHQALLNIQALYTYDAVGHTLAAAKIRYRIAKSRLALVVTQEYFTFLLARDDLRLTIAEGRALREELARAKRSFALGRANITDANEARARYEAVQAERLGAQNALRIARSRIERMIGVPAYHLWRLALTRPLPPPQQGGLAIEEAIAMRENLVLRAARDTARAANAMARASGARHYPTITAEATYSYNRANNGQFGFGSSLHQKTIGLDLSIPLYQGGELSAARAHAVAQAYKAHIVVLRTERRVQFDVHQALLNINNGYAQVRALKAAEHAAHVALASDRLGVRVGVRNTLDVLRAEQAYYRSRRDVAKATYNYLLSRLSLKAAISHLTQGDINRLNALLRPPSGRSRPIDHAAKPG